MSDKPSSSSDDIFGYIFALPIILLIASAFTSSDQEDWVRAKIMQKFCFNSEVQSKLPPGYRIGNPTTADDPKSSWPVTRWPIITNNNKDGGSVICGDLSEGSLIPLLGSEYSSYQ